MNKVKMEDAAIREIEAINAEMRLLMVKRNRILNKQAEKYGCSLDRWKFDPNTYEFTPTNMELHKGPVGTKHLTEMQKRKEQSQGEKK